jgi:hypothetical protein
MPFLDEHSRPPAACPSIVNSKALGMNMLLYLYLVTARSVCSCTNTVCIGQHRQAINFLSLRQSIFTGTWSTGNLQFYIDLNSSVWGCTLGPCSFLFGHWLCCGLSCVNCTWRLTGFQWQGWIKAVRQAVEWWKSSPPRSDSHQSN